MRETDAVREWADELLPGQFRHLFDHLPGTMFFAKDSRFRLMMGNPAFVRRCGFRDEVELVGKTDDGIFPPRLASKYRADDERVLRAGKPLHGLIELFPGAGGSPEWFVTDKLPLFGRDGRPCGICGTVRSYEGQRAALQPYLELADVAEHMKANCSEPLDVGSLARMAELSVRQFGRKFLATFRMTPRSYLMQLRINRATELLAETQKPITEIALAAGFYDHSDFARHFKKHTGQSASEFRRGKR
ncbi:MAG: helix-turn-helix domain-containing protein [Planctomycetota bacterium]